MSPITRFAIDILVTPFCFPHVSCVLLGRMRVQMAIDRLIDKLPRNLPPLCKYFLSDSCRIANCRNLHRYHDLRALCRCVHSFHMCYFALPIIIAAWCALNTILILSTRSAIPDSGCADSARAATSVSICTRSTSFGKICPSTRSGSSRPHHHLSPIPIPRPQKTAREMVESIRRRRHPATRH